MERNEMINLLGTLDSVWGISGHEELVGDCLSTLLADCVDEEFSDALGNRFFVKKGKNPNLKVLVTAHMDEIGFVVQDIWDDGYVAILPVGWHDTKILMNQVLTIHTANGDVEGVIGTRPIHQGGSDEKAPSYLDLKLDVGTSSRKETEMLGVCIGDPITNERGWRVLNGNVFSGKAVDNRSGCAAMVAAMKQLKGIETEATIYCCGTVMEELGCKGAAPAATKIQPDVAICLDVCFAATDKAMTGNGNRNYLGSGPVFGLYDWSGSTFLTSVMPKKVKKDLIKAAEECNSPYQLGVTLSCATDASTMTFADCGVATGGISIPNRYVHCVVGMVSVDDVINASNILAKYLSNYSST